MHTVTGYFNGIKKNTQYEKKPAYIYYLHTVVPKKCYFKEKKNIFTRFTSQQSDTSFPFKEKKNGNDEEEV